MVNFTKPQRFYQVEFNNGRCMVYSVIDLEGIEQIDLLNDIECPTIDILRKGGFRTGFLIDKNKAPVEEFQKIVGAWTSYKNSKE